MSVKTDLLLQNIKRDMKDIETLTRLINEKIHKIKRSVSGIETQEMFDNLKKILTSIYKKLDKIALYVILFIYITNKG